MSGKSQTPRAGRFLASEIHGLTLVASSPLEQRVGPEDLGL